MQYNIPSHTHTLLLTNTASNIQDLHATLDTNVGGKIMFMTSNGTEELLTRVVTAEMETATPTCQQQVRARLSESIDQPRHSNK